ncbi:unnamed protein product [Protopolystoma xenopodis]|uniref:Uncharacterized protein n=1 Tax=Protopolystoma xenopodis TaxID=117903 RepID=A0A3S5BLG8_9PLAT|nr:unnamed protein product [Protopolystoma xenopodis]
MSTARYATSDLGVSSSSNPTNAVQTSTSALLNNMGTAAVAWQSAVWHYQHRYRHAQHEQQQFAWDESSRLCDYTHLHSYAYDFHLRTIESYLASKCSTRMIFFKVSLSTCPFVWLQ